MHSSRHVLARDIILEVLTEVALEKLDLLREIIDIEELHLADKSSVAPTQVAAAIERAAKAEAAAEAIA